MKITIDLDKSLEENASRYFEESKTFKNKLEGAKKIVMESRMNLRKEQKKEEETLRIDEDRKRRWYEKFRWFKTSDGFLVVAGKDASTNEEVIKTYAEKNDLVFHTSLKGSPFSVIKNDENKEIPEQSRQEARIFTATYSKAWENNYQSLEVIEVEPDQVTKDAQSGEYLEKGSFMIYGERRIETVPLQLSLGVIEDDGYNKLIGGPHTPISESCKKITRIVPGKGKKSEISNELKKKYKMKKNDDILKILPAGGSKIL